MKNTANMSAFESFLNVLISFAAQRIAFRNYYSPAFIETNHKYDHKSIMHFGLTQFAKTKQDKDKQTFYPVSICPCNRAVPTGGRGKVLLSPGFF